MTTRRRFVQASAAGAAGLLLLSSQRPYRSPERAPIEVNLAGYENGGTIRDKNYNLPSERTLRYFRLAGISTVRLPTSWHRLQPTLLEPLSEPHAAELEQFLALARSLNMQIIIDLHSFARRDDAVLGTSRLPIAALTDFWERMARRFAGQAHGYDLMNEPHDLSAQTIWPSAAQACVDAVRRHDRTTFCYVEGDDWSNAARWQSSNADLAVADPAGRLIYSAHIYFDRDTSGQYRNSYDADGAYPTIGAERLAPFVAWCRDKKVRGHIGEFGVPYRDARWLTVLDVFVQAVADARDVLTGAAYWMAGEWVDFYELSLQPTIKDGQLIDQPQLSVLTRPR
jgi:aryl-phospho-beta-D-glucosidase BglC (GH1 family)